MGVEACRLACRFLREESETKLVVDPFCGHGTALAVANHFGFDALGGLLAGLLATAFGAAHTLLLEGALLLLFVAFVLTRRRRLLRAVADNQQY